MGKKQPCDVEGTPEGVVSAGETAVEDHDNMERSEDAVVEHERPKTVLRIVMKTKKRRPKRWGIWRIIESSGFRIRLGRLCVDKCAANGDPKSASVERRTLSIADCPKQESSSRQDENAGESLQVLEDHP